MSRSSILPWIAGTVVALAFFVAARVLPPIETHAASIAVQAGYTNRTAPLVAILLLGAAALGVLLFYLRHAQVLAAASAAPAPWPGKRMHVLAACILCIAVIVLVPVWSAPVGYFGSRLALMDAGKVPYRDFEYAYGYAVAYLPYGLRLLGFSVHGALVTVLCLAAVVGVLSVGAIVERCVPDAVLRTALFWTLVVCAAFVGPGPSLNYNFARYALPFALLFAVTGPAARLSPFALFAAAVGADLAVYLLSPEIGFAFSVAVLAWLAIAARLLRPLRIAAAAGAVLLVSAALLFGAPAMFATFGAYAGTGNVMPVVPNPIMLLSVAGFIGVAAAGVCVALAIWAGGVPPEQSLPLSQVAASTVLAAALLPAVIGRAGPAITIAYGFVPIVMASGLLGAGGQRRAAAAMTMLFAAFAGYGALNGLHGDVSYLRHRPRPREGSDAALTLLATKFPGAYDPLMALKPPRPAIADVGYYPGWEGSDVVDAAGIARKSAELARARYYILPVLRDGAVPHAGPSPQQSLDDFAFEGAYPFALRARPGSVRFGTAFIASLYARCHPLAAAGPIVVCRLATRD